MHSAQPTSSARHAGRNLKSPWWGAGASAGNLASGPTTPPWLSPSPRWPPPGRTCVRKKRSTPSPGAGTSGHKTPKMLVCRPGRSSAEQADTVSPHRQHVTESAALHKRTGRTAGNGSLMRTAPVALAYLDDEAALVEAARAVSELTHHDPEAGDACVLWCLAIRHAILTGVLDARIGLQHIDIDRRDLWASRLDVAEASQPSDFTNNGWVVEACRVRGRPSRQRLSRRMIRLRVSFAPITCAWPSTQRSEEAGTPTPWPPSQADCSALPTGPQRSLQTGVACCMAGQGWRHGTWWHWRLES